MSSPAKIFTALVVAAAVVALGMWLWLRSGSVDPTETVAADPTPVPAPTPTPTLAERLSDRLVGTTLATSDAVVRELVSELSSRPELASWLANEDLVRRFVAAVDNTANGISPTRQLEFLRPKTSFKVIDKGDELVIDPSSYARYDLATRVFVSLDTEGTVALYRELEPLMDDAFAEISPPGTRFSDRLGAAIDHLLEVTPPTGPLEVERRVVTYAYTDERLEGLSEAQRQLLRMGPDNVLLIKAKLRDLNAVLAEDRSEE
jgi:hypothetical protein